LVPTIEQRVAAVRAVPAAPAAATGEERAVPAARASSSPPLRNAIEENRIDIFLQADGDLAGNARCVTTRR